LHRLKEFNMLFSCHGFLSVGEGARSIDFTAYKYGVSL
jgi:hypothetical protein